MRARDATPATFVDVRGRPLGPLTGEGFRLTVPGSRMSPHLRNAAVAAEDRRFWRNSGIDVRSIARAVVRNVRAGAAVEGASTITQQLVKNRLGAFEDRSLKQKLLESALALRLTHSAGKEAILTEYLNAVYFANGAHGAEAAARTYFAASRGYGPVVPAGVSIAATLQPHEAALIVGVAACPELYDPATRPRAARARRDDVLAAMHREGYLTARELAVALAEPLPPPAHMVLEEQDSLAPYFTSWIRRHLMTKLGAEVAFTRSRLIETTLDLDLQAHAERATRCAGRDVALVALDTASAEVRAVVGGRDYFEAPWNLATQGRHPAYEVLAPVVDPVRRRDEAAALLARELGVRTRLHAGNAGNPFPEGATPIDVATVYRTAAAGGIRLTGTLASPVHGPTGVRAVHTTDGSVVLNEPRPRRAVAGRRADELRVAVAGRYGRPMTAAAGRRGAWAVGFAGELTVAAWVGSASAPQAAAERIWRDFAGTSIPSSERARAGLYVGAVRGYAGSRMAENG